MGTMEGASSAAVGRDVEGGTVDGLGNVAEAADVAGLTVGSGLVGPPGAGGTLKIDVSVET